MAEGKTCYHVSKRENDGREWKVFIQGSSKVIKLFPTQKEALDYLEKNRTTTFEIELPEGMTEEEASKILVKAKNDKSFQDEWKLEKEMIKNRQVCETCKHWQVGNYENCLKKFICHLPDNTCLNWEECTCLNWKEGIKAEYYPYPPNSTWEEKEEINKKHIEEWKKRLKPLTK